MSSEKVPQSNLSHQSLEVHDLDRSREEDQFLFMPVMAWEKDHRFRRNLTRGRKLLLEKLLFVFLYGLFRSTENSKGLPPNQLTGPRTETGRGGHESHRPITWHQGQDREETVWG